MTFSLTRRQQDIVDYLRQRAGRGLPAPSLDEVCAALGVVSRGSMHKHVAALAEAGVIEPMHGLRRGLRLAAAPAEGVPLLGRIAAGRPIEAVTHDERVDVPAWLRPPGDCYVLEVRGDSMQDEGIFDGDRVVVAARSEARDGEVVVALLDGTEATLKTLRRRGRRVVLQPANRAYAPIEVDADRVAIQGVVTGLMRRVG